MTSSAMPQCNARATLPNDDCELRSAMVPVACVPMGMATILVDGRTAAFGARQTTDPHDAGHRRAARMPMGHVAPRGRRASAHRQDRS